jgi:hypothetical protein
LIYIYIQHISRNMTNYLIYKYASAGTFRGLLSVPIFSSTASPRLSLIVLGMLSLAPCGAMASPLGLAHVANWALNA